MAKSGKITPGNIVVWIILALLIVGLAGFGATNFGGSVNSVGRVGQTEIDVTRYANALQQEIQRIEQQTGQRVTFAQAQEFGLDRAVLAQIIGLAAIEDEAAELGISVGDETVAEDIRNIQAFQGIDGGFDREAYRFALDRAGIDTGAFEEQMRVETARTLLQGAVVAGLTAPPAFADTLYAYARESRDLTWARVGAAELAEPVPAPTDEELLAFYEANPEMFSLPEARRITYAWITPEMLSGEVEVDEDTLRRLYEDRIDQYRQPERRLVERLVFGSAQDAQAAADRIAAGEASFEEIVADRGLDLADIDMGDVTRDALSGAAAEAVFALEEPGVAGPVESGLGPALFRMNAILPARETTFETAAEELRADAAIDVARRRIEDALEPVDDLLASGATLEELAEETELALGEILWTPESAEGIAGYEAFRSAAEAAEEGDFPEIAELGDGGIFALRLDEIVPPRVQPFDEVEVAVIEAWEAQQTATAARARAEELLAQIANGADPAELGLSLMEEDGLTRDAFVENAPLGLVTAAFEMEPGSWRAIDTEAGAALVRLDEVNPAPDGEEAETLKAQLTRNASQGYAQDLLDAYTRALQSSAGIEINQATLNAIHAQFQ
jgi:peptidyl-prolyl cis-trans isomerase D